MKKPLLIMLFVGLVSFGVDGQQAHCGFDAHLNRMLAEDPSGVQTILEHQARAEENTRQRMNGESERAGGPRIIPTVFHVIHQGGSENISYEQIEDQMRILNEDYRRQNADAANTRAEFLSVAADANVEFRLAQLDPSDNCTDGVVRVWSPLTENASDASGVKALSYWPSSRYFNVWVVSSIDNEGDPGIVLGYAQFPGFGSAQTDGVVVRSDRVGSIGTAAVFADNGRVLTHEAGHWLGLLHTFQGGCNGGFLGENIDDTPPSAEATPSNCPHNKNTCSNDNPDLPDMVENYMDYSNGACQNTFTLGQKDAMDAVLDFTRSQIHSTANLNSTGVLLGPTPCAPIAHFYAEQTVVCTGQQVTFTDDSYNAEVTTYAWNLTGATPDQSGDAEPTVVYNTPGFYSVTMNVSNAQGSDSHTKTDYVRVIPGTAQETGWFSFEGFEETEEDYLVLSDDLGNTWQETNTAFTGGKAIYLNNFSGNPIDSEDELLLPSVDLTQMNDPDLHFRVAYRQRSGGESDNLRVYVSRNCGDTWSLRYNKSGASLATVSGTQGSAFTPSSPSDWELTNVNLGSFENDSHVLVKFRGTSDEGNNIYLDDIQISGPLGVGGRGGSMEISVSPNPMNEEALIGLNILVSGVYRISITDIAGKLMTVLHDGMLPIGRTNLIIDKKSVGGAGVYFLRVENDHGQTVRKLVVH